MPVTGREAALLALERFRKSGMRSENALDSVLNEKKPEPREAALASRLFYGVIQRLYYYDAVIAGFSTVPVKKIQPKVLDILRLICCQILDFDRVPDFSAVSEGVELCRKISPKAAGFVNAVSRRIAENKNSLPEFGDGVFEKLSVKYSHPVWLTRRLCEIFGEAEGEKLMAANGVIPPVYLQLNTVKCRELDLEKYPFLTRHPYLENCYTADSFKAVSESSLFKDGILYIQDPAAKMAVMASGVKPGDTVIDVCSAPGGKSFSAACMMENAGRIYAFDVNEKKIPKILDGAEKLGLTIISADQADGRRQIGALVSSADVVIADVPCSGFGVIRKKPEIRYKDEAEVAGLPKIQLDILKNAAAYVKPGGVLLYSTCTVLPEENSGVIGEFLAENGSFVREDFEIPAGRSENGEFTFLPHKNGTDGFFACKLRRVK